MKLLYVQIHLQTQFCHGWDGLTSLDEEYTTMPFRVFTLFLNLFYHDIGENAFQMVCSGKEFGTSYISIWFFKVATFEIWTQK